jgi:membrane-bound ClpP family serine protease
MSGGTPIALAADEVVMDANAVLGPVDPQIGQSPAASVLTVLERKKPEDIEEAKSLGLPISKEMTQQVYDFMNLFPQPTRTRPSVEYVPAPYRASKDRAA